jgi:hypothetical protein
VKFPALVFLALGALSPSKVETPKSVYYVMEFDAEIEGERFSFETKVACWTKSDSVLQEDSNRFIDISVPSPKSTRHQ